MLLTTVFLSNCGGTDVSPEAVLRLLWAHATPADGLQHVRVRAGPGRTDVAMFVTATSDAAAAAVARSLCRRAIDLEPQLRHLDLI